MRLKHDDGHKAMDGYLFNAAYTNMIQSSVGLKTGEYPLATLPTVVSLNELRGLRILGTGLKMPSWGLGYSVWLNVTGRRYS